MEITPASHTLTFTGVLSESRRIIKSNYSHFLIMSLLFLPLSTSLIIIPTLRHFTPNHHPNFPPNPHPNFPPNPHPNFPPNHHPNFPPNPHPNFPPNPHRPNLPPNHPNLPPNHPNLPPNDNNFPPIHHLVYLLIIYTFTLCATSSITYNAHHIFSLSNAPTTTPLTTLTTITKSLFPLAFTAVVSHALMFLASLTFLMFVWFAFMSVQTLVSLFGLRIVVEYDSVYFTPFSVVLGVVLFVVMMWLYVNWLLVNVVVVTESKWGFEALVRSRYLLKGMRSVAVKLLVFYGVLEGVLVLVYSRSVIGYGLGSWAFCLNVVFGSGFLMLLFLQSCVANVVLYNYCKAIHGELVIDVGDYVGLSVGDEKVPYIVTVVTA